MYARADGLYRCECHWQVGCWHDSLGIHAHLPRESSVPFPPISGLMCVNHCGRATGF
jgi:hypothetical protein